MSKFELFSSKNNEFGSEKVAPFFEERKSVIGKLIEKFPKLRSLILVFITTTAMMSAPELGYSKGVEQETQNEPGITDFKKQTAQDALEKITDKEFRDLAQEFQDKASLFGSNIPVSSMYSEIYEDIRVNGTRGNKGNTYDIKKVGNLPKSASKIIIGIERIERNIFGSNPWDYPSLVASKSILYVTSVPNAAMIEGAEVEKITVSGFGSTPDEALENAIFESIYRFGVEHILEDVKHSYSENNSGYVPVSTQISISGDSMNGQHFIKEYHVIKTEELKNYYQGHKDKEGNALKKYEVIIEITKGQLVTNNESK